MEKEKEQKNRKEPPNPEKTATPEKGLEPEKKGFRFPIRIKLMIITSAVVFISLSIVMFITLDIFQSDMTNMVSVINSRSSSLLADKVESQTQETKKIIKFIYTAMQKSGRNSPLITEMEKEHFGETSDFIYAEFRSAEKIIPPTRIFNTSLLSRIHLTPKIIRGIIQRKSELNGRISMGETVLENISPELNYSAWLLGFPILDQNQFVLGTAIAILRVENIAKNFMGAEGGGITRSFLVDASGKILMHPDGAFVQTARDMNKHPGVERLFSSKTQKGLLRYQYEKEDAFAAYERIPTMNAGVITTIPADKALEGVKTVQYRSLLISLAILSIMMILIYFFALTLSAPIKKLVSATREIEEGNYETSLKSKSNDEIGDLTNSFNHMARGLGEREKLKGALGKFVNEEIANQVLAGELKLGGNLAHATIFFSDIRSFTAISEKLTPTQVVEFLNDYMTRMVGIVGKTNGVVDKFIGDAIMAVWGAPVSHGNDAENCVNAALMMRRELIEFNKDRGGPGKPIIKIGSGINTGEVLAGQIGSEDRLEYTVIGDAVNLASRIESLNKPFGTDILISSDTLSAVEGIFHVVPMQKIKVKGKEEPQQIYAVLGRVDDPDSPKTIEDMRALVGIETPKEISDGEEKEVKYQIIPEKKQTTPEKQDISSEPDIRPAPSMRKSKTAEAGFPPMAVDDAPLSGLVVTDEEKG